MNQLILFTAQYLYIFSIIILGLYFLLLAKEKKIGFLLFSGADLGITYLIGLLAGSLYYNPRPFVAQHIIPLFAHAPDNGFPSDHVLLAGALASIVFCYNRKLGILLYLIALVIGVARVLSGVHHWLDIIGSLIITIAVCFVVYRIAHKYFYV